MEINSIFSKKRFFIVVIFFSLVTLFIVGTYGKLAFMPPTQQKLITEEFQRGSILDKNGKTLAIQSDFFHVAIRPSAIKDVDFFARTLAPVINIQKETVISAIQNSKRDFLYLKKKISRDEKETIESVVKNKKLSGIHFDKIPGRIYPENSLAAQVVGFMGNDGNGLAGIEYSMNNILQPTEEEILQGRATIGNNIFLTLDTNLQYKLEEISRNAMQETKAESFMLVAAEAKTGEILSYISLPSIDLNNYPKGTPQQQKDKPAMDAYEPGSVFKIFTAAACLESKTVSPDDTFICDGHHTITAPSGEKATINCLSKHGRLTLRGALKYSCNDIIAQVAEKIDTNTFLSYLDAFGFGKKTGIELPGETPGLIKDKSDPFWSLRSKPTMAIGQELSVSALQMIQATTAIANEGKITQLTLVSKITKPDGTIEYLHKPTYKKQVISPSTAKELLSYMETVTTEGTGRRAALGDISIGVKTGTAQMLDPDTRTYSSTDFVSNCVSIFPIEDPQIILYIVITKAKGETYSGRIVAPIIADAADIIIDHLGLARGSASSISHDGKITITSAKDFSLEHTIPDFSGAAKKQLTHLLNRKDLNILMHGDGYVVSQIPPEGTAITENMNIELFFK